jgi:hypothetical protein
VPKAYISSHYIIDPIQEHCLHISVNEKRTQYYDVGQLIEANGGCFDGNVNKKMIPQVRVELTAFALHTSWNT